MQNLQNKVRTNLIHFFIQDFHFPLSTYNRDHYDKMDKQLRSYVWYLRDILLEGNVGTRTIDLFLRLVMSNPTISEHTFQLLIKNYFISLLYRLQHMGYFEPEDEATNRILRQVFQTYINPRMEYLSEHIMDNGFLLTELKDSYTNCFHTFYEPSFKHNVSKLRMKKAIEKHYRTRQDHMNQIYYPHRPLLHEAEMYDAMEREFTFGTTVIVEEVNAYINSLPIEFMDRVEDF